VALLDAVLENCIFYISLMFEFSHSQGQIPLLRSKMQCWMGARQAHFS
jgi:hypothetical protein